MPEALLKILFAEDLLTDFELAEHILQKDGINFISKLVDSEDEFIKSLKEFSPDIIISDYSMPSFDGMAVLKLTQEFNPLIPVIILTGSIDEETAVACMKAGANDYVLKEIITRLPYAVKDVLANKKTLIEKEKAEQALLEKTNELDNYFTNALDLFSISSLEGKFLRLNNAWEKTLGYELNELIGKSALEFVHEDDIDSTLEIISDLANRQEVLNFVNRYRCKDGTYKWIEWRSTPAGGKVYGAARDITDRKKAEEEIFNLSERLRHYLATSPTITYALKINNGEILPHWISENITTILGYKIYEAMSTDWWFNNLYPDDKQNTINSFDKVIKSNSDSLINEYRFFTKQKQIIWIRNEIRILRDKTGNAYEIVGTWTDISKRKKAEDELIKSEQRYRRFFEEDLSAVYLSDVNGRILECNPAFVVTFGFKDKEEAISSNASMMFVTPEDMQKFINMLKEKKIIVYYEQRLFTKNKKIIYVIINAIGIFNEKNELSKIQVYLFDITEIKNLQHELINAKETAERADYLKTEFLAQMSHEIRTPINAILNAANLIKEETYEYMNSEIKEFFPIIDSASKRIIRTIDAILNMSELQIGSYVPQIKNFDIVEEIIEKLFIEFKFQTIEKRLNLTMISETKNTVITGDPYSIEQIFLNLLDNAIKYTETGSIEIVIYRNITGNLCIDVRDTGIGIGKDFIPDLFEAFRQEEHGYTRRYEGNGLGLALVKNYCKLNNAEIKVESEKGVGSTFTVIFNE